MTQIDIGSPPVLDGLTGTILDTTVDGAEARVDTTQPSEELRLIDVPLESLNHDFTKLWYEREEKLAEKKRVTKDLSAEIKALTSRIDPIVAEIDLRVGRGAKVEQPSMFEGIHGAIDVFDEDGEASEDVDD